MFGGDDDFFFFGGGRGVGVCCGRVIAPPFSRVFPRMCTEAWMWMRRGVAVS